MAYAFVGRANSTSGNVLTYTATSGNLLVVCIQASNSNAITSVATNTAVNLTVGIATVTTGVTGLPFSAMYYLPNCGAGITSITATFSGGTPAGCKMIVLEYSGIATASPLIGTPPTPNGQAAGGASTSPNAITSPSFNVTTQPALVIGVCAGDGDSDTVSGTGYTQRGATTNDWAAEDLRVTSTGNQTATFTAAVHGAGDRYSTYILAFAEPVVAVPLAGQTVPITGGAGLSVTSKAGHCNATPDTFFTGGTVTALNLYVTAVGAGTNLYLAMYDLSGNQLCGGSVALTLGLNTVAIASGPTLPYQYQSRIVFTSDGAGLIVADDGDTFRQQLITNSTVPLPATLPLPGGSAPGGRASVWASGAAAAGAAGKPVGGPSRTQWHWR